MPSNVGGLSFSLCVDAKESIALSSSASVCVALLGCDAIVSVESPPHRNGWDQALCLRCVHVLSASVCAVACFVDWAATQMLPACCICVLELTWMFPGSLLRYHEKFNGRLLISALLQGTLLHAPLSVGHQLC